MDYGGGSWMMVPTQSPGAQDLHSLRPHQQQLQFQSHPQQQQQQQQQQQLLPLQQQQQQQHHQSLASDFHILHLVESLAGAIESGTRDQHLDSLVNDLTVRFNNCQQLLNSISGSINAKAMTVEGQRSKVEEAEQLLNHRRDLINKYRGSVEELVNPDSRM